MQATDNCETCKRLIRSCSGLDYFPADPEVRTLLISRLHCLAKDHQHAAAIVDRWLDTHREAPKVADLAGLAAEIRASPGLPAGCEDCAGAPFVITEAGGRRCSCLRGQALRQMDQRRAGEAQGEPAHGQ